MISKELLTEVLPDKQIDQIRITDNTLWFKKAEMKMSRTWSEECINIYELAYKCKKWALDQNCCIRSYILKQEKEGRARLEYHYLVDMPSEVFEADTEYEAIFKACEWILKEINK